MVDDYQEREGFQEGEIEKMVRRRVCRSGLLSHARAIPLILRMLRLHGCKRCGGSLEQVPGVDV